MSSNATDFSLTSIMQAVLNFPTTVAKAVTDWTGSETLGAIAGGAVIVGGAIVGGIAASAATAAVGGVMGEVAGVAIYMAGVVMCCESMRRLGCWTAMQGMSLAWSWLATAAIPVIGAGVLISVLPGFGVAVDVLINDLALTYAACTSVVSAMMWPWEEHTFVANMRKTIGSLTLSNDTLKAGTAEDPEVKAMVGEVRGSIDTATKEIRQEIKTVAAAASKGSRAIAAAAQEACGHVDGPQAAGFQPS